MYKHSSIVTADCIAVTAIKCQNAASVPSVGTLDKGRFTYSAVQNGWCGVYLQNPNHMRYGLNMKCLPKTFSV